MLFYSPAMGFYGPPPFRHTSKEKEIFASTSQAVDNASCKLITSLWTLESCQRHIHRHITAVTRLEKVREFVERKCSLNSLMEL